jgi:hypothetical protein
VPPSVPVDHVEYHCHAVAVGRLDKAPEGAAVAKVLIHTEEPNRFKALIDRKYKNFGEKWLGLRIGPGI